MDKYERTYSPTLRPGSKAGCLALSVPMVILHNYESYYAVNESSHREVLT